MTTASEIQRTANIFGLGTILEARRLTAGQKNASWKVTTESGACILRFGRATQTVSDLQHELTLVSHLRNIGYPAPEFFRTCDGADWAATNDTFVTASRFVDAAPYLKLPGQLEAAARALADFHSAIQTFRSPCATPTRLSLQDIIRQRIEKRVVGRDAVRSLLAIVQSVDDLEPTSATVIHGAPRHSSYLFKGSKVALVLDFDSSRLGSRDLDVSIAVMSFCRGHTALGDDDVIPLSMKRFHRYAAETEAAAPGVTDWYRVLVLVGAWFAKRACRNDSDLPRRAAAAAALASHARMLAREF